VSGIIGGYGTFADCYMPCRGMNTDSSPAEDLDVFELKDGLRFQVSNSGKQMDSCRNEHLTSILER
jgi:hypothetical protein